MTPTYHAEKPSLTSHPVIGGDALSFPISPTPPKYWWIAMRRHAQSNPSLIRPWDEERHSRFVVQCPTLAELADVIESVNTAVTESNHDNEQELTLRKTTRDQRADAEATHLRTRAEIQHAIDDRYRHAKL